MSTLKTGLEPRDFRWIIKGQLAISQRIGGYGDNHRRIRRTEEITWLLTNGFTSVLSLCDSNQNLVAYQDAGLEALHHPTPTAIDLEVAAGIFEAIRRAIGPERVVLLHKDTIDDTLSGLLGGYLVYSGLLRSPIQAMAVIQEILARPLGPLGRSLIPSGR